MRFRCVDQLDRNAPGASIANNMGGTRTSLDLLGLTSLDRSNCSSPTEERLKSLSLTLLNVLCNKDFNNPAIQYVASDIESHHDAHHETITASGKENLIEALKDMVGVLPNYHAQFLDSGARVSERTGKGTVWVLRMLTGLPDGLRRESVSVLNWERRDSEWVCTKHRGIRGAPCSDAISKSDVESEPDSSPDEMWKVVSDLNDGLEPGPRDWYDSSSISS